MVDGATLVESETCFGLTWLGLFLHPYFMQVVLDYFTKYNTNISILKPACRGM
jgi:hypothetical protein